MHCGYAVAVEDQGSWERQLKVGLGEESRSSPCRAEHLLVMHVTATRLCSIVERRASEAVGSCSSYSINARGIGPRVMKRRKRDLAIWGYV